MNQTLIQQLRIRIVLIVEATRTIGMGTDDLGIMLRQAGYKAKEEELQSEIAYLVERKLIKSEEVESLIGPKTSRLKITANGRDWLAENHFAPTE